MNSVNKFNNKIVIHSLKSGLVISANRDKINPSHLALVKKYRQSLELPDKPIDITFLFNRNVLSLLNDEDELFFSTSQGTQRQNGPKNANIGHIFTITSKIFRNSTEYYIWMVN